MSLYFDFKQRSGYEVYLLEAPYKDPAVCNIITCFYWTFLTNLVWSMPKLKEILLCLEEAFLFSRNGDVIRQFLTGSKVSIH